MFHQRPNDGILVMDQLSQQLCDSSHLLVEGPKVMCTIEFLPLLQAFIEKGFTILRSLRHLTHTVYDINFDVSYPLVERLEPEPVLLVPFSSFSFALLHITL